MAVATPQLTVAIRMLSWVEGASRAGSPATWTRVRMRSATRVASSRGGFGEQEQKFFAAEACGHVVFAAQSFGEQMTDALEHAVAVEVAEGVVDVLEAIDVDEDDADGGAVGAGAVPDLGHATLEGVAVGEAGKFVALGDELELAVAAAELLDEEIALEAEEIVEAFFATEAVVGNEGAGSAAEGKGEGEQLLAAGEELI